ncbi:hypothetical protein BGX38DRAFT_1280882 [Terfezia claveryi]|nr:hypothetical protein BGX38DRAFT_1280882 [Terfezia claveryi]
MPIFSWNYRRLGEPVADSTAPAIAPHLCRVCSLLDSLHLAVPTSLNPVAPNTFNHVAEVGSSQGVPTPPNPLHKSLGKALFIYNEVYTNQVIYSLHRSMRVTYPHLGRRKAISFTNLLIHHQDTQRKQLSFVGKQSVPPAFAKTAGGPLPYDKELLKLPKVELKKKLQDQKANSVADLSAALQMQLEKLEAKDARTGAEEIVIKWQDVSDGELAKTWPGEVVHMRGARPERDKEMEMKEHIVKEKERLEEVARVKAVEAQERLEKQEEDAEERRGGALS